MQLTYNIVLEHVIIEIQVIPLVVQSSDAA